MEFINKIIKLARKNYLKTKKKLSPRIEFLNKKRKVYYKKFITHAEKRPVSTFSGLLLMLLGLIIISSVINRPRQVAEESSLVAKEVEVYTIGTSPKITVQAQVEKSGVIKVVALGGGVVQNIGVNVGQEVSQGTNLVSMSTNYQGGNAFTVARQLAQVQFANTLSTYKINKELIDKQRDIANKSDESSDKLREISNQSVDATQSLINFNNDFLTSLADQQAQLEADNVGGANNAVINQIKGLRSQLMSGNSQLDLALKNTKYAGDSNNAPVAISDISRDITLRQLDLQQKALNLSVEVGKLSLTLAQINEAIMFPASPITGIVERIYVRIGQSVNPGTPLVQISGNSSSLIAIALLSREMADGISKSGVSTLHVGNQTFDAVPFYVSTEATDGQLYTAEFAIPLEYNSKVTDKGYIIIEVPVDFPKTGSSVPFIPIDSVFQTQDQAFLFVAKNGKAESKKVSLGQVIGRFVEVKQGLNESDQVILNRNVIQGDPIRIKN